jgi:signal transduction histidine kinase
MFRFTTNKLICLVCSFCLLLISLTWSRVLMEIAEDRQQAINAAVERNSNLVASLAEHAVKTIRNADAVLQFVKMEYEQKGKNTDFNSLLNRGVIDEKYFSTAAVIGENGRILLCNVQFQGDSMPDLSDRPHFLYHKTHKDELFISLPVLSKRIDKYMIVLSRRINKPDGSFGGTVAVQVEPSTFTLFYANANLRTHDIMSLIDVGGITYARRTGRQESCGENVIKSPLFGLVKNNPVGSYFSKDAIRGIPTYFSYRKLQEYPMIATVGSAEADVLAGYYEQSQRAYIFGAIITVFVLLFCVMICKVLIYRKHNTRRLRQSEWRYQRRLTKQIISAQEREREKIGYELHDNVNQILTTVKLYLEMAISTPDMADKLLPKSIEHVMDCIKEIRNLSRELSGTTLGTQSLIDSMKALIESVELSGKVKIRFDHNDYHTTLEKEQKQALYRIVQEQLTNILKHAGATEVTIILSQACDQTELEVRDNGKGFDTNAKRNGIGLNNILSRAKVFGGGMKIVSANGQGCSLKVWLPIGVTSEAAYAAGMY